MRGLARRHLIFTVCAALAMAAAYFLLISSDNVQKLYLLEKVDPLIAGYPVNIPDLKKAINLLDVVEKSVMQKEVKSDPILGQITKSRVPQYSLPVNFLRTLPETQSVYERFIERPTWSGAIRLLAAQEKSARSYRDDARVLKSSYEFVISAYGISQTQRYFSLTQKTMTTPEIILGDLKLIMKNGDELLAEIQSRRQCLYWGICPESRKTSWEVPAENRRFTLLSDEELIPYRKNILEFSGPYLVPTVCFGYGKDELPINQPLYFVQDRWGNLPSFYTAKLGTDTYFTRLSPAFSQNPLFKPFADAGLTWLSHREATPYRCDDLSYLFRLATLRWVRQELVEHGGFAQALKGALGNGALTKKIADAERRLTTSAYPSYEDARLLGTLYETVLTQGISVPTDVRDRMSQLIAGLRSEYAGLDRLITMLASYLVELDDELRVSGTADMHYLFSSRMHLSMTFLVHSPSIWRLKERPALLRPFPSDAEPDPNIRTYTELIRILPKENLLSQFARKSRLYEEWMATAAERFSGKY